MAIVHVEPGAMGRRRVAVPPLSRHHVAEDILAPEMTVIEAKG